ncbi:MAG: hypothetical protein CVU34_20335, partial [Betaproteobacteria bacterium HGW-Betaproteobacteria-7]
MCDKRGLPVLVTRYAIAPVKANAAPVSGNFAVSNPVPLGEHAMYTQRLLRSGYLYVFDEARNTWAAYFVSPDAYMMPIDLPADDKVSPSVTGNPAEIKPCSRNASATVAGCITISSPKQAGLVWLGFSDAEWTSAVLKNHQDTAYRKQHMRAFNVKKWLAATQHPHSAKIDQVASLVADYRPAVPSNAFDFSPAPKAMRLGSQAGSSLIQNCEQMMAGKGAIVAVDDPAGVVMDMAGLMKHLGEEFLDQDRRRYHLVVNGWLNEIEGQIKDGAQRKRLDDAMDEREYREGPRTPTFFPATRRAYEISTSGALSNMDSPEQLERVANGSWQKYAEKLKPTERSDWLQKFSTDSQAFDASHIAPLAEAHVAWMKSSGMKQYMGCNFDTADIEVGLVYVTVMTSCVLTTEDKLPCRQLYEKWLSEESISDGNLLFKALTFNQKTLGDEIKGMGNGVTWAQLAWDKLIDGFDKSVKKLAEGRPDVLGRFIAALAGSLAGVLKSAALQPRAYATLVAIGVAARQPIVRVEVTGSKRAFRAALIREIVRANGQPMAGQALRRAVAAELRRLQVHGVPLGGTDKRYWLLMVNPDQVRDMPANLKPQQRAEWLLRMIWTPERVEALNMRRWEQQVSRVETTVRGVVGYSAPFGFAVLGLLANRAAWLSLIEDEKKAMAHVQGETLRRVWAQGAQLLGASGVAVEQGVKRLVMPFLSRGVGAAKVIAEGIGKWGGRLGVAGAVVMSLFDFGRAWKESREGSVGGTVAYFISGALGFIATWALASSAIGVGIIFTILLIGWAFVMTYLVDDKLQDWLERCLWGKLEGQRYGEMSLEERELNKA